MKTLSIRQLGSLAQKSDQQIASCMPRGVDWGDLLFTESYARSPRPTLLPHFFRYLQLGYMVVHYGELDANPSDRKRLVRVLDAGAGLADLPTFIRAHRFARGKRLEYVAADIDPRKRTLALERNPSLDYRLVDLRRRRDVLDLGSYDVVVCSEVVEHLPKKIGGDLVEVLAGNLRPGGHLLLTVPKPHRKGAPENPHHVYEWPTDELHERLSCIDRLEVVDWFYMRSALRDLPATAQTPELRARAPRELIRSAFGMIANDGMINVVVLRKPRKKSRKGSRERNRAADPFRVRR